MDQYAYYREKYGEYGEVLQVNHPIVAVVGLPSGTIGECYLDTETADRLFQLKID